MLVKCNTQQIKGEPAQCSQLHCGRHADGTIDEIDCLSKEGWRRGGGGLDEGCKRVLREKGGEGRNVGGG